ncbi:MAG: sulfatase-like hydrolase/transferase [Chloroflexota bacterium]
MSLRPRPARHVALRVHRPLSVVAALALVAGLVAPVGAASPAPTPAASPVPGASSAASPSPAGSPTPWTAFDPEATPGDVAPITAAPPILWAPPARETPDEAAAAAARARAATLPTGVARPDIVVLLIDDLSAMDDRLWERLPTIKRLFLDSGVRFTGYTGNDPLCCPGRANLLTGQWTIHHGVTHNDGRLFDPRESIATELHAAGYWTGIFGKYFNNTPHLRDKTPNGWDQSFIYSGGYWGFPAFRNGRKLHFGKAEHAYSTYAIGRNALAALNVAPGNKPRFIWLAPFATHAGIDRQGRNSSLPVPPDRDIGAPACQGVQPWSTAANLETDMSDKPAFLRDRHVIREVNLTSHCESLLAVDRMLANVLAKLQAQGRPEPMVILAADNGMAWGAHRWRPKMVPYATPIPLFIHWPALLGAAPATVPTTVTNVDIAPTLCAIAGCEMGPFPDGDPVDGISFLALLNDVAAVNGGTPAAAATAPATVARQPDGTITGLRLGRWAVIEEQDSNLDGPVVPLWHGIRTTDEYPGGRWVYTVYSTGEQELYDLSGGPCWTWSAGDPGDPCELTNLAAARSLSPLRGRLASLLDQTHPTDWPPRSGGDGSKGRR